MELPTMPKEDSLSRGEYLLLRNILVQINPGSTNSKINIVEMAMLIDCRDYDILC